jgi:hypothetical protein
MLQPIFKITNSIVKPIDLKWTLSLKKNVKEEEYKVA